MPFRQGSTSFLRFDSGRASQVSKPPTNVEVELLAGSCHSHMVTREEFGAPKHVGTRLQARRGRPELVKGYAGVDMVRRRPSTAVNWAAHLVQPASPIGHSGTGALLCPPTVRGRT
jgi:hypothetical protein